MAVTIPKIIALVIAIGYIVAAALWDENAGPDELLLLSLVLLVPLVLIWWPEIGTSWPRKKTILGTYDNPSFGRSGRVWRDSHPAIVAFMGWFLLIGLPILLYILWYS